jgi:hypothetical protein
LMQRADVLKGKLARIYEKEWASRNRASRMAERCLLKDMLSFEE